MEHTVFDILAYALVAAGFGFFIGHVWPRARNGLLMGETAAAMSIDDAMLKQRGSGNRGGGRIDPAVTVVGSDGRPTASATAGKPSSGARREAKIAEEQAKWHQRVSKLVESMRDKDETIRAREKTIQDLEHQLSFVQGRDSAALGGSGVRVREELIKELEGKLKDLNERYRDVEGALRRRDIEIDQLTQDAAGWKEKWAKATQTLDEREGFVKEHARKLEEMNAALIEAKGNGKLLRLSLSESNERVESLERAAVAYERERGALENTLAERSQRIEALEHQVGELEAVLAEGTRAFEQLQARHDELAQRAEAGGAAEKQALENKLHVLEAKLEEHERLKGDLMRSLDERRRKTLKLESNINQLRAELDSAKAATGDADEPAAAPGTGAKRGRRRVERERRKLAVAEEELMRREKSLYVLSQQLDIARQRNEQLFDELSELKSDLHQRDERIAALEAQPVAEPALQAPSNLLEQAPVHPDNLTKIRGIGDKLAKRLNALGIYQFDQIAVMDAADIAWLEDRLQSFRGRVERDCWVEQAQDLAAGGSYSQPTGDDAARSERTVM